MHYTCMLHGALIKQEKFKLSELLYEPDCKNFNAIYILTMIKFAIVLMLSLACLNKNNLFVYFGVVRRSVYL